METYELILVMGCMAAMTVAMTFVCIAAIYFCTRKEEGQKKESANKHAKCLGNYHKNITMAENTEEGKFTTSQSRFSGLNGTAQPTNRNPYFHSSTRSELSKLLIPAIRATDDTVGLQENRDSRVTELISQGPVFSGPFQEIDEVQNVNTRSGVIQIAPRQDSNDNSNTKPVQQTMSLQTRKSQIPRPRKSHKIIPPTSTEDGLMRTANPDKHSPILQPATDPSDSKIPPIDTTAQSEILESQEYQDAQSNFSDESENYPLPTEEVPRSESVLTPTDEDSWISQSNGRGEKAFLMVIEDLTKKVVYELVVKPEKRSYKTLGWKEDFIQTFFDEKLPEYKEILQYVLRGPQPLQNEIYNLWAVGFDPGISQCQICQSRPIESTCVGCGVRICDRMECVSHGGCRDRRDKAF